MAHLFNTDHQLDDTILEIQHFKIESCNAPYSFALYVTLSAPMGPLGLSKA